MEAICRSCEYLYATLSVRTAQDSRAHKDTQVHVVQQGPGAAR